MEKRRRIFLAVTALLVAVTALQRPTADLSVATHDAAGSAPIEVRAALDLGLLGGSVLITWTARRLTR